MMVFGMLLGAATGINLTQAVWRVFGWGVGEVSIAVPVGGGVGALAGALLCLVRDPRLLVLVLAVYAGGSAGAVAGRLPWGAVGEVSGLALGALVGWAAWAAWLFLSAVRSQESGVSKEGAPGGDGGPSGAPSSLTPDP